MENYEALLTTLALLMGTSWASGINLYAVLLILGIGSSTGHIDLPAELVVLENPLIIGAAGVMYTIEFFADKIPGFDSVWDTIHTFIRIPAGAMLAVGAVGDVTPALEIAAGILGGSVAATSHATKSGTRLFINTSPEPVTNWSASLSEDLLVLGGLWAALNYPLIFLILFAFFIILVIWLLPRLWASIKVLLAKIGKLLGSKQDHTTKINNLVKSTYERKDANLLVILERIQQLRNTGALTETEFLEQKNKILNEKPHEKG